MQAWLVPLSRIALILTLSAATAIPATAQTRPLNTLAVPETIRGKLILGTLEGVIETADGTMFSFWSKGAVARKLLSACNDPFGLCEAEIIAEHEVVKRVLKVRKIQTSELTAGERETFKDHLTRN